MANNFHEWKKVVDKDARKVSTGETVRKWKMSEERGHEALYSSKDTVGKIEIIKLEDGYSVKTMYTNIDGRIYRDEKKRKNLSRAKKVVDNFMEESMKPPSKSTITEDLI